MKITEIKSFVTLGLLHLTGQLKSRGAKGADQQKSKMELETNDLGTISLINRATLSTHLIR